MPPCEDCGAKRPFYGMPSEAPPQGGPFPTRWCAKCAKAHKGAARNQKACHVRERRAELAQKLGQLQPFLAVFPPECMGQLALFGPT